MDLPFELDKIFIFKQHAQYLIDKHISILLYIMP